jgi:hypothetical protein
VLEIACLCRDVEIVENWEKTLGIILCGLIYIIKYKLQGAQFSSRNVLQTCVAASAVASPTFELNFVLSRL